MTEHFGYENMPWWVGFPENQGRNYRHTTRQEIRNKGAKKWLCSLPILEYAYVLLTDAMLRYGGEIDPYLNDLFNTRMIPILNAYDKFLMKVRVDIALLERKIDSLRSRVSETSVTAEIAKLRAYTMSTRKALRGVVRDFIDERNDPTLPRKATEDTLPECYPV